VIDGCPAKALWVKEFSGFFIPEVDMRLAEAGNYEMDWQESYGGSIEKPKGVLEGIQPGLGDIGIVTTIFHSSKLPSQAISAVIPFVAADARAVLGVVSFVSIWLMRDNFELAMNLLKIAVSDSVMEYTFATVPLFTFMGLIVSKAGLGSDIYEVMSTGFRRVKGGIGMATVGANAVYAAVTGSSIASASVFSKVLVPQMLRHDYNPRFAVGVVAGSSVLGMIIPPSAMLIISFFVAEQSVGDMFLAGVVPGILLAPAYVGAIWFMGRFTPGFVGGHDASEFEPMPWGEIAAKTLPILGLIVVVLGGIYTGWLTPVEAGAAGAALGLAIALIRRKMSVKLFWDALLETGHVTAAILFLITAASIHSRMLGLAGLPNELGKRLATSQASFFSIMVIYVVTMLFLGTLLDTASIILIVVPLFLPLIEPMGLSLVWFGIVTMVGAEIGLLTPPLGISCFVIKATLDDDRITLKDVFLGALPFAAVMFTVLILPIRFPALSLAILNEEDAPMRTVTADNITEVFTGYFGEDTDPRVRDVLTALAQHIHDFVLGTRLTHDEWRKGLESLEWAARITDPERNEFVLLSDVMGLSSLVDMVNSVPGATSSSVLGPFHVSNPPPLEIGGDMRRDFEGEVVLVEGIVRDIDGAPVAGAEIDIWQTAPNGMYSSQDPAQDVHSFHALMTTDATDRYAFNTVKPVSYTVPNDGPVGQILDAAGRHPWRPSHLHFIVKAEGCRDLVTEVFAADDPYLDEDTVFGVREDLVMSYTPQPAGSFPDGFTMSGKVPGEYSRVDIDFKLARG